MIDYISHPGKNLLFRGLATEVTRISLERSLVLIKQVRRSLESVWVCRAAVTKHHRLNGNWPPHSSGSSKAEVRRPRSRWEHGWFPLRAPPGLAGGCLLPASSRRLFPPCGVLTSSSDKDANHRGLGPPQWPHHLGHHFNGSVSKYSHVLTSWRLSLQHVTLGEYSSGHNTKFQLPLKKIRVSLGILSGSSPLIAVSFRLLLSP